MNDKTQSPTIRRASIVLVMLLFLGHFCHTSWGQPYPPSDVITGISFDDSSMRSKAPGSDNWPITWAANDQLYTSWGDGGGFGGTNSNGRVSLGVAGVRGDKDNYQGWNIAKGVQTPSFPPPNSPPFSGKSEGILAIDNTLYMGSIRHK